MRLPPLSAQTRVLALLGDPVAHSLSPLIQNAAIKAAGCDGIYVALRCSTATLPGLLLGLAHAGGGGNVTIPHKGAAAKLVTRASARVRATGACNTFWLQRGQVYGENTDVVGFSAALRVLVDARAARVLLIGAGGAARAAVYALLEDGVSEITVIARTRARVRELEAVAGRRVRRLRFANNERALRDSGYDVVINSTPLGLRATDRLPLRFETLSGLRAVFDMVYRRGGTRWVRLAQSFGIPAMDGMELLVQQGAEAFRMWWGKPAPIQAMRRAIG